MNALENILGAFQVAGTLIFSPLLRGGYNRWGATDEELRQPLPGDELVPEPMLGYTHAITIHTPAERVWPWLAQIGQGRGGLYSYDGLENLIGCRIHSADRILGEFQQLQIGDVIRMGPPGYPCFSVVSIEPQRAVILLSADPKSGQPVYYQPPAGMQRFAVSTWQFVLSPLEGEAVRLLVRQRLAYSPDMAGIWRMTEPVAFVMERKMLLGIRQRAEAHASQP
jgi:hypothetical protein